jgi:GNAT superfamily N-acetyltransferase
MTSIAKIEHGIKNEIQPISLRPHRHGDMGLIKAKHRELYGAEYGWDEQRMGDVINRITADFIDHYDCTSERCWIAEHDGQFVGCVMLVKDRTAKKTANLRLLLVERTVRGTGLGRRLVRQCTQFAGETGYARLTLWTNSILTSAIRLYQSEGYRLLREEEHETFGVRLTGQYWGLDLSGNSNVEHDDGIQNISLPGNCA